jgi:hypothetical protein
LVVVDRCPLAFSFEYPGSPHQPTRRLSRIEAYDHDSLRLPASFKHFRSPVANRSLQTTLSKTAHRQILRIATVLSSGSSDRDLTFVDSFRVATTRELTLSFCRRPEDVSRRIDLAMIDPTEQLLENLPRIAAVKTRQ